MSFDSLLMKIVFVNMCEHGTQDSIDLVSFPPTPMQSSKTCVDLMLLPGNRGGPAVPLPWSL